MWGTCNKELASSVLKLVFSSCAGILSLKVKMRDGQFRDAEVRKFINCLKEELHKVIDVFNDMQIENLDSQT